MSLWFPFKSDELQIIPDMRFPGLKIEIKALNLTAICYVFMVRFLYGGCYKAARGSNNGMHHFARLPEHQNLVRCRERYVISISHSSKILWACIQIIDIVSKKINGKWYRNIIAGSPPGEWIFFFWKNKVCLSKIEFLNFCFLAKNQ